MFTEYVIELRKNLIKNYIYDLKNDIGSEWLNEKIDRFIEKHPFCTKEEIEQKISEGDKFVCSIFIKDPFKQNLIEKELSRLSDKLTRLPPVGKDCICFDSDGDINRSKLKKRTKSADFYYKGVYYSQRFTHENGGSQDNASKDVQDFLRYGSKKSKVGAILDGGYWTDQRIDELKQKFPKCIIKRADDFIVSYM